MTEIDASLAALGGDQRSRAREVDLLRFQVGELAAAAIANVDEDEVLVVEEDELADAAAHREAGEIALVALTEGATDLAVSPTPGAAVSRGQVLLVLEAMKVQMRLTAPSRSASRS